MMNNKKNAAIILITFILLTVFALPAYASDDSLSELLLSGYYPDYFDAEEFNSVRESVFNAPMLVDDELNLTERKKQREDSAAIDVNHAYKVFDILNADFVQDILNGEKINDMLSDEYWWYYATDNNTLIDIRLREGQWEVVGYGSPTEATIYNDVVTLEALNNAKEEIITKYNANIEDIKCFQYSPIRTDFALFITDSGEFLVPFGCRTDFFNLNNEQVYTSLEAAEILKDYIDSQDMSYNSAGYIGGYGLSSQINATRDNLYAFNELITYLIRCVKMFLL